MLPKEEGSNKNSGSSNLAQMISIYKHIMGDSSETKDLANVLTKLENKDNEDELKKLTKNLE